MHIAGKAGILYTSLERAAEIENASLLTMWPILFHIGDTSIPTYGILVTLGYLVGTVWLWMQIEHAQGTQKEFWALVSTMVVSALIGAKLGYHILEWQDFRADPWGELRFWRMGWIFWPGLIGAIIAGWLFQQVYNRLYRPRRYLPVADYMVAALPIGHWLGRLGCFAEGCCYGRATTVSWSVRFTNPACSVDPSFLGIPLHPVQLYEAAGELAIALFLVFYVLPNIRRGRFTYGSSFFGYILLYSFLRFTLEFFRGDDRGLLLGPALSPSQWFSLLGFLVAGGLLYRQGLFESNPNNRSLYL